MNTSSLQDPFAILEQTVYPGWILSLYLPAPPESGYDSRYHQKVFGQLDREHLAGGPVDDLVAEVMRRERGRVLKHLEGRSVPSGHGQALFAYAPYELLASWCLAADTEAALFTGTRARLGPVREQLAAYPPAIVVAADKEEARIFRLLLGEVEELVDLHGTEVSHHRQGGWSALNLQRHEEQSARHNLAAAASWLNGADLSFYREVRLAAPPEAHAALSRLLASEVQARVEPAPALPMYLSPGQMANRLRARPEPARV